MQNKSDTDHFEDGLVENGAHTRRAVLLAGGAAIAATSIGFGLKDVAMAQSTPAATVSLIDAATCVLTPEMTAGPYYLDGELIRQNIIEDRTGLPLKLTIAIADATTCMPIEHAAVDIWHCDAHGFYSGVSANMPGPDATQADIDAAAKASFLRGIQLTNADGIAEFETIYPGWYISRTIHIHMKIRLDGEAGKTYEGGHTAHTGQLFFDDAITEQVMQIDPYAGRPDEYRTLNSDDGILAGHEDEQGFMVTLTQIDANDMAAGFLGTIVIGVDPAAESTQQGMQGGPGNGGPPPSGGSGGTPPGSGG